MGDLWLPHHADALTALAKAGQWDRFGSALEENHRTIEDHTHPLSPDLESWTFAKYGAATSIADNTLTAVSFNNAWKTTGSSFLSWSSGTPTVVTVEEDCGILVTVRLEWASNATGYREARVTGSSAIEHTVNAVNGADTKIVFGHGEITFVATNTLGLSVLQNSGGALDLRDVELTVTKLTGAAIDYFYP